MHQRYIPLILTLFLFTTCKENPSKPQPESQIQAVVPVDQEQVDEAPLNRQIQEILNVAEQALDDNERAIAYGQASELLMEKGDFQEALRLARLARQANPTQKEALTTLGEYYIMQRKYRDAQQILDDVLYRHQEYARAHYLMGNALVGGNQRDKALAYYRNAIQFDTEDIRPYNNLAVVYVGMGRADLAMQLLRIALQIEPDFAQTYKNAGIAAEEAGLKAKATAYYTRYIGLNPWGDDVGTVKLWISELQK